jgi:Holliday junction resolvase YEN1
VLRQEGKQLLVPPTFPDFKALGHYCNPVVTPEDELRNINYLKSDWDPKIDQAKLRVLLRHRFNIWTKGFMKHIAPVFMIRQLARCPSHDEALSENLKYDIQLKRTKQKKAGPGEDVAQPTQLEKKIAFYPLPAVDIDITEPLGSGSEDWSIWEKNGSHYDPAEHVECNILSCFLEHGLPEGFLVAPEPPKRQRKQNSGAVVTDPGEIGVAPTPPQETDSVNTVAVESATKKRGRPKKTSTSASADAAIVDAAPKKRGRPPKDGNTASAKPQPKKRKALAGAESPAKSSPPVFRLPREFSFASSADSTQNHEEPTISAPRLTESTHPAINPPSQLSSFPTTPQAPSNPVPGETTSPATLRALRASRWGLPGPNASTTAATAADTPYAVAPKVPPGVLVIDLTD